MSGFEDFWAAWPSHPRKGQKSECRRRWEARGLDAEADHIIAHVRYMLTTKMWQKDDGEYIPAPLVYMNASRWDGAEIPPSAEELRAKAKEAEEKRLREYIERGNKLRAV